MSTESTGEVLTIQEAARIVTTASREEIALASHFYRWGIFRSRQQPAPAHFLDCDFFSASPWVRTVKLMLEVMVPKRRRA